MLSLLGAAYEEEDEEEGVCVCVGVCGVPIDCLDRHIDLAWLATHVHWPT